MQISVVNLSERVLDEQVLDVVRAVNRQIGEDFAPHWHISASLRFEANGRHLDTRGTPVLLRGDAIVYLDDVPTKDRIEGIHERSARGLPFGIVYTSVAEEIDGTWSTTLSHEALELVANPQLNEFVWGPHPDERRRHVFHWREVCDPVQCDAYKIDGVLVSNFVLPGYYDNQVKAPRRRDFLACRAQKGGVPSFGMTAGGYVTFWDPEKRGPHGERGAWDTREADAEAARRRKLKAKATLLRAARRPAMSVKAKRK